MPWTEDIPWSQNRAVQTAPGNRVFALRTGFRVRAHDWGWMRHTHINEVLNARFARHLHRFEPGSKIDIYEFPCLRRTRMRNPDKLDESVRAGYGLAIGISFQRIAGHRGTSAREPFPRLLSNQGNHFVPLHLQDRYQSAADVT